MSKRKTSYPPDEFDIQSDAVPRSGVHRASRSAWSQIWPYLVALIVAAALGLGSIYYLMQSPNSRVNELINDATNTADPNGTESSDLDAELGDEDTEDPDADNSGAEDPDSDGTENDEPDSDDSSSSDDPADDEPAAPEVDRSISVRVLNASGRQGVAATEAAKLTQDGFTNVTPDNFQGDLPPSSVIYYKGAGNQANAERIGELLGITNLSEVTELRAEVSVVIR